MLPMKNNEANGKKSEMHTCYFNFYIVDFGTAIKELIQSFIEGGHWAWP